MCRERPGSSKKGPTATSAQTFTFFLVLDPVLSHERPGSSKKGCKWHLTSGLLPFPAAWTPFCAESGLDPSEKGSCDLASKFASTATFSAALPHRDAVPVLALSLFLLLLLSVALCAAVVVWIYPLCSKICRAYLFIPGLPSSVGRAQGP